MTQSRTYYQLDVFTNAPFSGNPLAVFPDARGISDERMQQIARETNLSETVFVLPSAHAEVVRRLRIFTPIKELPMAGHPVVGAWNLLAGLGTIENAPENGKIEIKHELGIGVLPVEIEFEHNKPKLVTMTQGKFDAGEIVSDADLRSRIAAAFDLSVEDFAANAPIQVAGCGIDFTIVPIKSLEILRRAQPNQARIESLPDNLPGEFSLFARETLDGAPSTVHTRMFAPEFGIIEDPATGSAAGALGAYLVHHNLLEGKQTDVFRFTIEQGDFINRPSRMRVEITGAKQSVERVRVGGEAVVVAKGEMYISEK